MHLLLPPHYLDRPDYADYSESDKCFSREDGHRLAARSTRGRALPRLLWLPEAQKKGPVGTASRQPGPWTVKNWFFPEMGFRGAVVAWLPKIHGSAWKTSSGACGKQPEPSGPDRYPVVLRAYAVDVPIDNGGGRMDRINTASRYSLWR